MRLNLIYEAESLIDLIKDRMGRAYFKKLQDPNRPEKLGHSGNVILPFRTGNQDTPMSPRHRRFFNAPLGATQGKIGWGDPDDYESRRTRSNTGGEPQPEVDWPVEQGPVDVELQKKARKAFGHLAVAGQRPKGVK
jgi:hypothetical protein